LKKNGELFKKKLLAVTYLFIGVFILFYLKANPEKRGEKKRRGREREEKKSFFWASF
jgi:hypothetical protein